MNQVIGMIFFVITAILGGGSSLFMLFGIPVVIVWKIYRRIRYGYKITD